MTEGTVWNTGHAGPQNMNSSSGSTEIDASLYYQLNNSCKNGKDNK